MADFHFANAPGVGATNLHGGGERERRHEAARRALSVFAAARLDAHSLMRETAALDGLPALCRAQATAISGLAGLKLHRILGEADAADFLALRDDLEAVARVIDPLIAAVGAEAAAASHAILRDLFEDQVFGALDGNATFNLTEAAIARREERAGCAPPASLSAAG